MESIRYGCASSSKSFDVIGFGALNVDKLFKVKRVAGVDDESYIIEIREESGGSAANTIVGLARAGLKTGFIGKVGDDREGRKLIRDLKKEGVDVSNIVVERGVKSGIALCFFDDKGHRTIYVMPGANDYLNVNDINLEYASRARILHITSFIGDAPLNVQRTLLEHLPGSVRVSLDPGAIYAQKGLSHIEPLIRHTNILLLNHEELRMLTGKASIEEGVNTMLSLGVDIVAVKLGEKGCFVTNGYQRYYVEPYKCEVVDPTGAGDAFNAGFLYGLIKGRSLSDCGKLGNFFASHKMTKFGARSGLPRLSEIESFIARELEKK